MYVHDRLVDFGEPGFPFHIIVRNIGSIGIDIFNIRNCEEIGDKSYNSKQGNGQY